MHTPLLLIGGAPRVPIDAVRHMTVPASGASARQLQILLNQHGRPSTLLLSQDAQKDLEALRYTTRKDMEQAAYAWLTQHPGGGIVCSAAINDYEVDSIRWTSAGQQQTVTSKDKIPSGADSLNIRLRPTPKFIDTLRPKGLTGPLIGFKYEDASTVIASAQKLLLRSQANLVLANSLCGKVQALVDHAGIVQYASRQAVLDDLACRLIEFSRRPTTI